MRKEAPERKKRFRRAANEIEKNFRCEVPRCNKHYGSEGSLLQHIKLKHPERYEETSRVGRGRQSDSANPDSIFE
jgi:transcription elongation factor Elf1